MFLCLDNLCDIITATPAIEVMKIVLPKSQIAVLTRPQNVAVFSNNYLVKEIITDEAPWWSKHPIRHSISPRYWCDWFKKIIRLRRERFDAIIDLRGDLRHLVLFGAVAEPKKLFGYARTGGAALLSRVIHNIPAMHEIDKKLALLSPLGNTGLRPDAKICLSAEELVAAKRMVSELIPYSRNPTVMIDPGAKAI